MKLPHTNPPAAAPIAINDFINGIFSVFSSSSSVAGLHDSIADAFQMSHCFSFSSGKAALTVALLALKELYPKRYRVVVPAFCCFSVPSAIDRAGCTVQPCEINPATLDFDFNALAEALTDPESILALCPTHLFGMPSDCAAARKLINDPEITIIEDAAQAMGTLYHRPLQTQGDIRIFSLGRGKAFSTGEGGILITGSDTTARAVQQVYSLIPTYSAVQQIKLITQCMAFMIFGHPRLFWLPKMIPFLRVGATIFDRSFSILRLSAFQAGIAKRWRIRLGKFNADRIRCASYYVQKLSNCKGLHLFSDGSREIPFLRFPVLFESEQMAEYILQHSENHGLGIAITYPSAIDKIKGLRCFTPQQYPKAQKVARAIVTLPCHSFMREKEMDEIVSLLHTAT